MNLQFPFLLQYLCLFPLGIVAARRGWIDAFTGPDGSRWTRAAIAAITALPVIVILGGGAGGDFSLFMGGLHVQALALAVWESWACVTISLALLRIFSNRFAAGGPIVRELAAGAYTVYIIHAPVVVLVTTTARGIAFPALAKFAAAAAVALPFCFLLAASLRRAPGLRRIL
jgi:hypothetical protein